MPKVYHVVMVAYSKCTKSGRPYAFTNNGTKTAYIYQEQVSTNEATLSKVIWENFVRNFFPRKKQIYYMPSEIFVHLAYFSAVTDVNVKSVREQTGAHSETKVMQSLDRIINIYILENKQHSLIDNGMLYNRYHNKKQTKKIIRFFQLINLAGLQLSLD